MIPADVTSDVITVRLALSSVVHIAQQTTSNVTGDILGQLGSWGEGIESRMLIQPSHGVYKGGNN